LTFLRHASLLLSPYLENSLIRPKSFVAAELKKETENDTSIYSSTWCLVRDRHHLFNGSISIYGYLQREQIRLKTQACQLRWWGK
jgi:hypothetical protein